MKIMICENDKGQINLIKNIFSNYRFKHIIPKKNRNIFNQVLLHKPAILILNENYDKEAGVELLSKLRNNPVTENIPVIFISNNRNIYEQFVEFSNDSFVQLMPEPYRIKHLRHYVDRWTTFRSLYIKN